MSRGRRSLRRCDAARGSAVALREGGCGEPSSSLKKPRAVLPELLLEWVVVFSFLLCSCTVRVRQTFADVHVVVIFSSARERVKREGSSLLLPCSYLQSALRILKVIGNAPPPKVTFGFLGVLCPRKFKLRMFLWRYKKVYLVEVIGVKLNAGFFFCFQLKF